MSWRGISGGIQAAKMNHDVVMTPTSNCYFDYYQSADKDIEPPAFGGLLDYKQVYSYEPVPAELTVFEARHVLGAQGNMWSEFLTSPSHTEYMALPRMTALSEVVWTQPEQKKESSFLTRLGNMYTIFQAKGYNFHVPAPQGILKTMMFIDSAKLELINPFPFGQIYYTTDGSVPTTKGLKYTSPVKITSNTVVKTILALDNGKTSAVKSGEFVMQKPLAASEVSNLEEGLRYDYYEGAITTLNDLFKLPLKHSGKTELVTIPANVRLEEMALAFNGFIKVGETGVYTFKLISDDGSQLLIDDQMVINHDGPHGPEPKEGQVALEKGLHRIKVLYFEAGGGETVQLFVRSDRMKEQVVNSSMLYRTRN